MHLGPAQHRDLHRLHEGVVGDEIRRGDDHAFLRPVDERDHGLVRIRVAVAGAARQHLRGCGARRLGFGEEAGLVDFLLPLDVAVGEEDHLELRDDRAFHAHDEFLVHQPRLALGVGDIQRAGVADASVDHHDLAVVSQVEARAFPPEDADGQHRGDGHAGAPQLRRELAQAARGTGGVHEHAAVHPAAGGAAHGIGDEASRVVVRKDVEEQMHMALRGVDVGDEPPDRLVVVVDELELVAIDDAEVAEIAGEQHGLEQLRRDVRGQLDLRPPEPLRLRGADARRGAVLHREPALRQVDAPDARVDEQAEDGL